MPPLAGPHELRRLVEDRGEVRVVGGGPGIAAAELEAGRGEEGLQAAEEGAVHGGGGGGLLCRGRRGRRGRRGGFCPV